MEAIMAGLKAINVGGETIYVEVTDLPIEGSDAGAHGEDRWEKTSAKGDEEIGERIRGLIGVVTAPVQHALSVAGAAEWTVEVSVGFEAQSGLPFIATGKANGAVKVTAKWAKESQEDAGSEDS
jgi:hypothetical protein